MAQVIRNCFPSNWIKLTRFWIAKFRCCGVLKKKEFTFPIRLCEKIVVTICDEQCKSVYSIMFLISLRWNTVQSEEFRFELKWHLDCIKTFDKAFYGSECSAQKRWTLNRLLKYWFVVKNVIYSAHKNYSIEQVSGTNFGMRLFCCCLP